MKRLITNIKSRGSTLCLTTAMALLSNFVTAQVVEPVNTKMQAIATPDSRKGWVHFSEGTTIDPQTIFVEYRDAFELSADDDMRIRTVKTDELGMNHYKYDQYYKNVRVQFGEFIVHQQADGFVKSANGRLITGLNLQDRKSTRLNSSHRT